MRVEIKTEENSLQNNQNKGNNMWSIAKLKKVVKKVLDIFGVIFLDIIK